MIVKVNEIHEIFYFIRVYVGSDPLQWLIISTGMCGNNNKDCNFDIIFKNKNK